MSKSTSMFFYNILLPASLLISVCIRQNVLSMVHLIFIVCFPILQSIKSRNIKVTVQTRRPLNNFVRTMFYAISIVFIVKLLYSIAYYAMPEYQATFHSCDGVGRTLKALGLDDDGPDLCADAALTAVFAWAVRGLPDNGRAGGGDVVENAGPSRRGSSAERAADSQRQNRFLLFFSRYTCLAVVCMSGVVAPSFACSVYYALFVATTTAAAFDVLSDAAAVLVFRAASLYTCVHLFALFAYQTEWARHAVDVDAVVAKRVGLIAYRNSTQCGYENDRIPDSRGHQFVLPILLVIQHFVLWTYSDMMAYYRLTLRSTESRKLTEATEVQMKFVVFAGIKTIGFRIVILVWSIFYRGWLTLMMLLWATITWIHLNTRRNIIVVLIFAVGMLFVEYLYLVLGDEVFRKLHRSDSDRWSLYTPDDFPTAIFVKTLFMLSFWIALDHSNKHQSELNYVMLKMCSEKFKIYISHAWTASLILVMLAYGLFGFNKINLIRISYVVLALLFLFIFQVSFKLWKKTIYLFWSTIMLYSIFLITVTYVFQFEEFSEVLATNFHISKDLQGAIGLNETDNWNIITPAIISIDILVYFQYFHGYFMKTLDIENQSYYFGKDSRSDETPVNYEQSTRLSTVRDVAIAVLYVHFNKLQFAIIAMLIMYKPCMMSGMLLLIVLLWMLTNYNRYVTTLLFLYVALCVIITLAYQFPVFLHNEWMLRIQLNSTKMMAKNNTDIHRTLLSVYEFNAAELLGLKKFNDNALLFDFLLYELLILMAIILKNVTALFLKFKHYPQKPTLMIFPNVTYADMNNGIPEFLMFMANDGFTLFGLEITLTAMMILVVQSMDACALIYALCVLRFTIKSRPAVAKNWPYFVAFAYLVIVCKYALYTVTSFNSNHEIPWLMDNILRNVVPITLYEHDHNAWISPLIQFDFITLILASHQLVVFRNTENGARRGSNGLSLPENDQEFSDFMSQTRSYLDVLKRILFVNSMWIILFCLIWTGTKNVNLISLGYLWAGIVLFKKSTFYFLLPPVKIDKLWRRLLSYNISAIFLKVFLHLLGCTIFNYLQWHSCVLMQTFCIFCSPGVVNNQETCGITKSEIGFSWDVLTFILLMFQRRFFESRHFSRLAENAKITAVLASKMYITVQEWGRKRKDENRLLDSKSIMKIKEKVNKLRKNKERITKKKETHFKACLDGEHMFKEISDDVHLVKRFNSKSFSKYEALVKGSWMYRYWICLIMYVTDKINEFSEERRKIMKALLKEKQMLMSQKDVLPPNSLTVQDVPKDTKNYTESGSGTDLETDSPIPLLKLFLLATWNAVQSSTHLICYFAIFHNAIINHFDYITVTPVIMILFWGLLSVPRPSKTFWIVMIVYMQITGGIKYVYAFKEIPWVKEEATLKYINEKDFNSYPTMIIGFGDYGHRIPMDLLVLLTLFLHRWALMTQGLWTYSTDQRQWEFDEMLRNKNGEIMPLRLAFLKMKIHFMPVIDFYNDLRNYHREGTVDVYPAMMMLMIIMISGNILASNTVTDSVAVSRVSSFILRTFILYILIIVVDRWLYVKHRIGGKLIFYLLLVTLFILSVNEIPVIRGHVFFTYIVVSAYQIRNGYSYRNCSWFIWSQYTLFNLVAYKLYYYCPFVHEARTVLDWIWTDSSMTIMEWFKMDELFTHICCVKCVWNFRMHTDTRRGEPLPGVTKLMIGGGIVISILVILIFPIVWFSMFKSTPDTPSLMEFTITIGEDLIIFTTKSDEVYRLDSTDFQIMNEIYAEVSTNISRRATVSSKQFLGQHEFDEISAVKAIPQSINTYPFTPYVFSNFKKIILASSSVKITVRWSLTHHNGMKTSRGKNTVPISRSTHAVLANCLNATMSDAVPAAANATPVDSCPPLIVHNLLPKFIVLPLKSPDADVKPELTIHNPSKPYMDIALTFHFGELEKPTYWWDMREICPARPDANYLKKLPYSSCVDDDVSKPESVDTSKNIAYNVYVFSDRYSNTLEFLDDKGIIGLYMVIIVYVGYKLAFDIFRSFKFKLSYTETPYPDRVLQLCYEIYLARAYGEFELEEELFAMLIFLFRSPQTLIRFTRLPATI